MTDVCFAVGCQSLGTFSTRFTELVGVPPSVYKQQAADDAGRRPVVRGQAGHQTGQGGIDQESRSAVGRAPPSVLGMDIKIHNAFLPHDDRDAAVAFYCDTLGFELRNDVGYNGMHWLTVGPPDQPDVNLVLFPPGADPGVTDDERRIITEMMAKGTYAMLTLATEDLDGLFEKLQATDAEVMQEPTDQHWGDARLRVPRPVRQHDPHRRGEVTMTNRTMTCEQLGGACDLRLSGETADDVIKAAGPAPARGGPRRRHRARAGPRGDEGSLAAPDQGDGLVQGHQEGVRGPARGLTRNREWSGVGSR